MSFFTRLLLLSLVLGRGWADGTDTCHDERYDKYPNHVMCLEPKSCPEKELMVAETDRQDQQAVLHALNTFRSVIASGRTAVYHPAANMRQLTWDDELAAVAQRLAEQCSLKADYNISIDRFPVGKVIVSEEQYPMSWEMESPPHLMNLTQLLFSHAFDYSYLIKDIPHWRSTPTGDDFSQV
ncbi:CRISP/Allergen/PR-1-like [Cloeon dipterum]|uniref:CRISP/Allergen/PR-1-like n=1 Tax=Cloeon dipterum TaxID=197152 RepID=UPI00322087FA